LGGAAKAISKAAGERFAKECKNYLKKNEFLPTGKAIITDAGGDLQCDYVIHTVGPIVNKQSTDLHQEEQMLIEAINSTLEIMKSYEF